MTKRRTMQQVPAARWWLLGAGAFFFLGACALPDRIPYSGPCESDADCGDAYRCSAEQVCVAGAIESDGGTAGGDGGVESDAGIVDSGVVDGGEDAGEQDGGVADGGPADAGADAGEVDAGEVDAGVDGGPPGPWQYVFEGQAFSDGEFTSTFVGAGALRIAEGETSGTYTSPIFGPAEQATLRTFQLELDEPTGRPLPAMVGDASEQEFFTSGGADLTDLVMLLQFDGTPRTLNQGDSILDSSLAQMDVVLVDNPPFGNSEVTDGKVGGAAFIAYEDYLDVTSALSDPLFAFSPDSTTEDFTFSMWMKVGQCEVAGDDNLIGLGGENPHIWLGLDCPEGVANFRQTNDPGNGGAAAVGITEIDDNRWHHLVGVRRTEAARVELFVDGVLAGTDGLPAGPLSQFTEGMFLGNFPIGVPPLWDYQSEIFVDEVAVFRRALSVSEIFKLYRRGATAVRGQLKACDAPDCAGEVFFGDGLETSSFYEASRDGSLGQPAPFEVSREGSYFQFQLELEADAPGLDVGVQRVFLEATAE